MASLTGKTIANTYKDLLQTATSGTGLPVSTPTAIQDGQGNSSGLKLSQTQIDLTGTVKIKGTELTANVSALNAVADFTAVSGFATGNGAGTIVGRTFSASTGISISNADGISGNPTFSLAVTSVSAGTYAGQLTSFDIDATGRITGTNTTDTVSATNVNATNIAGTTGQFSGDVSIGGSLNFTGALAVDSLSVTGDIHGNNVNVSTVFADGLQVTNAVCATSFHGSGAALTSITAASATNASYAASAGEAAVAVSSSHALSATFAQTAEFANSATNSTNAVSAVFASSATNATSAVFATSATNATNAINVDYGGVVETSSANLGTVSASDMFVSGPVSVGGTVDVSGAVSIGGGLFVVGDVSAGNIYAGGILYGNGAGLFNVPSESGGTVNFVKAGTGIHVTEDGVTTTNPITASGTLALNADQSFGAVSATNLTISASATFEDSAALHFGTDKDLTIQHNGSNSLITENGTGSLFVQSNEIRLTNTGSFSMLTLTDGQDAEFPYGVQVSGTVSATSFVGPTITSINSVIAGVSSTLATSIDNTNSNLTALSATLATSIANHLPLAGGTMTGAITLSGAPTSNLEAATKQYVDNLTNAAIHFHDAVRVESPNSAGNLNATYDNGTAGVGATLTNSGTQAALVIDGVTLNTSDRVLIYNQTDATQNGVYTVTDTGSVSTNWVLTRATDADSYAPTTNDGLDGGSYFYVQEGDDGAGEAYVCNNIGEITFGTTDITFVQFSSALVYTAGSGININGSRVVSTSGVPTDAELAAVSATLATSISNHMPLAGGTFTGSIDVTGTVTAQLLDLGTNNPRIRFDDSDTSNNGEITLDNTALRIEADEDNAVADSKISFRVDGSEEAFINYSGLTVNNAGIIRLNPSSGDDFLTLTQGGTQAVITADSTAGAGNLLFKTTSAGSDTNTMLLSANGDISFYDSTGVTQGFFWDASTQRLGLGTPSPSHELTVSAANDSGVRIDAEGNNVALMLTDETTSNGFRFNYNAPNDVLTLDTTNGTGAKVAELMRIQSDGNVGIGTSSPATRLSIGDATVNSENVLTLGKRVTSVQSNLPVIGHTSHNGSASDLGICATSSGGSVIFYTGNDAAGFGTGLNAERMRINASGNVGIGTDSPNSYSGYTVLTVDNATNGGVLEVSQNNTIKGQFYYDGTQTRLRSNVSTDLAFDTNDTERMRIDSSGNVKIDNGGELRIHRTGAGYTQAYAGISMDSSETIVYKNSWANKDFRFTRDGDLMVGRTSSSGVDIDGHVLFSSGTSYQSATSNTVTFVNRNSTDGTLTSFSKNGTTVGSIGIESAYGLYIDGESAHTGLQFVADSIIPRDNGARTDNATDLGTASFRFNDAHFGGTVNANAFVGDGSGLTGVGGGFTSGTLMLFQQTAAPTGWTKQTTHNDKALRVVSGTAGSGGSTAFTTALGTPAVSGSVSLSGNISNTTLSTAQIPSHNHGFREGNSGNNVADAMRRQNTAALQTDNGIITNTGGGGAHNHGHNFSGSLSSATTAINVQYVDLIIASKD